MRIEQMRTLINTVRQAWLSGARSGIEQTARQTTTASNREANMEDL
jgi:hypothetical protein